MRKKSIRDRSCVDSKRRGGGERWRKAGGSACRPGSSAKEWCSGYLSEVISDLVACPRASQFLRCDSLPDGYRPTVRATVGVPWQQRVNSGEISSLPWATVTWEAYHDGGVAVVEVDDGADLSRSGQPEEGRGDGEADLRRWINRSLAGFMVSHEILPVISKHKLATNDAQACLLKYARLYAYST